MRLLAEIALVAAAAIVVTVCIAALPRATPVRVRRRVERAPSRPDQLVRLERLVLSSGTSSLYVHAYLRPLLAEVVSHRLAARGQALETIVPATGRELLGDRLWEIVRPGRPFPEDRYAPGVTPRELGEIVDRLEHL